MAEFLAGAGKSEIVLPEPLLPGRENFVRVLDPIYVRVVLLQAQRRAALVSLELTSLMGGTDTLKQLVSSLTGADPDYIWITVSHTFSAPHIQVSEAGGPGGPGGPKGPGGGPGGPGGPQGPGGAPGGPGGMPAMSPEEQAQSDAMSEALTAAVTAAAEEAARTLRPAAIGTGSGQCMVNTGRDVLTRDGWWTGEGSEAFADHTLTVLRLDDAAGVPIAVVYNFAVQSSVLDHAEMPDGGCVVTGDLAGRASACAETRYPGSVALFLCGAAGDQAPRQKGSAAILQPDGSLRTVERGETGFAILRDLGAEFGKDLCETIASIETAAAVPEILAVSRYFSVPAKVMPDRSEVKARHSMDYVSAGSTQTNVDLLRIGDIALIGVKPELSASVGQAIREQSPAACTMVATMVNGGAKYMADRLAFQRCTYAAQNGPFAEGAAELLAEHALAMLQGEDPALTVYNTVQGDGTQNTALVLQYETVMPAGSVTPDSFAVSGRKVLRACVSAEPVPGSPADGPYVILELDPVPVVEHVRGRGEHINLCFQSLQVQQTAVLQAADGGEVPAWPAARIAVKNRTEGVDRFTQFERDGLWYNLFLPDGYDTAKRYPLVLFIHDAGCCGSNPAFALHQGRGAVGFAADAIQRETPCLILAPQIPSGCRMTTDTFQVTPELEKIMETVRYVAGTYAVDPRHIVTTGQSMGCMASCELLMRYPDFFAGALLIAGQWDPAGMAEKARHNTMWIVVSAGDRRAFPGMNAVTEAMEAAGAEIHRYRWDGLDPDLQTIIAQAAEEPGNIKYAVFETDSVVREKNPGPNANHGGTWALAYTLQPLLRWLVTR